MNLLSHLRIYSEFSIGQSTIRINDLIAKAKKQKISALAITDKNNLFAAIKFYQLAVKEKIKPIIASEISYKHPNDEKIYECVLYCQNDEGYENLSRIVSQVYIAQNERFKLNTQTRFDDNLWVSSEFIKQHNRGLIVLNGGENSDITNNFDTDKQHKYLQFWLETFEDRFYLETPTPIKPALKTWLNYAVELSQEFDIPVVATHPTYFLNKEDYLTYKIRKSIDEKVILNNLDESQIAQKEQYFLDENDFHSFFSGYDKNIFTNAQAIAKRCNYTFFFNRYLFPKFEKNEETENEVLTQKAKKGLSHILNNVDSELWQTYQERLDSELSVIIKMHFAGYFLTVADYVNWAKKNNIPVSPGRGSGAGSLVAYSLNITTVDPISENLFFERFLNVDRVSMPDFDIDFCAKKRGEVLDYIRKKYEKQIPVQIVTFGAMKAKAVVRDVARALSYPYNVGDRIAKEVVETFTLSDLIGKQQEVLNKRLIEEQLKRDQADENADNIKTDDEIKTEVRDFFVKAARFQDLYNQDDEVRDVVDNAIKLEGLIRNIGTHAGGVIIAPDDIRKYCPIYCDINKPNQILSQFEMKSAESIGLVKFDFLGVMALTVINNTVEVIKKNYDKFIDLQSLKLNNKKVYSLMRKGLTSGVFQLESPGMKKLIKDLKIENFDELVAVLALYRPGPLGSKMDKLFVKYKKGEETPNYLFEVEKAVLSETRGLMIFQEQVMKLAQEICGYTLAKADELRKAMGKKDKKIMDQNKNEFIDGGLNKGHSKKDLEELFNRILKFAEYGFNKSHSVAYAIVSYYCAYLKAYYPAEFIACEMSELLNDSKSLQNRILELKNFKTIKLMPPNINESEYLFISNSSGVIKYALGAIKGVGEKAADDIAAKRQKGGEFKDFTDFCLRVDLSKVNKGTIESLIYSGAMDTLFPFERKVKIDNLINLMHAANQYKKGENLGMTSLFNDSASQFSFKYQKDKNKTNYEFARFIRISHQFKALGYYKENDTPLIHYYDEFEFLKNKLLSIDYLASNRFNLQIGDEYYTIAQVEYFAQQVKDNKVLGYIRLSNSIDKLFEFQISLEKFNEVQEVLKKNKNIICSIRILINSKIELVDIYTLAEFRMQKFEYLVDLTEQTKEKITHISQNLSQWFKESKHTGDGKLMMKLSKGNLNYFIDLGKEYSFYPSDEYLDSLQYLTDFKLAFKTKNLPATTS